MTDIDFSKKGSHVCIKLIIKSDIISEFLEYVDTGSVYTIVKETFGFG